MYLHFEIADVLTLPNDFGIVY